MRVSERSSVCVEQGNRERETVRERKAAAGEGKRSPERQQSKRCKRAVAREKERERTRGEGTKVARRDRREREAGASMFL